MEYLFTFMMKTESGGWAFQQMPTLFGPRPVNRKQWVLNQLLNHPITFLPQVVCSRPHEPSHKQVTFQKQ